jgi:diguanylate cyclase (GGDEF)-like protein
MGSMYEIIQKYVLNDRWLFDATQSRLTDLSDSTEAVILQPVAARILSLLVHSPHTIISRRKLFDEGWRAYGFEVCDNSLNQVMHTLRVAFASLDPHRQYIKTVPRIGYCLIADVRPAVATDFKPAPSDFRTAAGSLSQPDQPACDDWWQAQKSSGPLSLLLIDVDQLRLVNIEHGRRSGDELLSAVEQCIRRQLHRPGDFLQRHEGAVFAARLPDTDRAGALHVAQRIRDAVHALSWRNPDSNVQTITVSIGTACTMPARFETASAFVQAAYAALQEAREVQAERFPAN